MAVQALAATPVQQATDALLAALPDQLPKVQHDIALAPSRAGTSPLLEALAALFVQPGASGQAVAEGIGAFRSPCVFEILVTRLKDRQEIVRLAAVAGAMRTATVRSSLPAVSQWSCWRSAARYLRAASGCSSPSAGSCLSWARCSSSLRWRSRSSI